ncbi:MAG: hypothetical protein K2L51_05450 [Clostridiales bacterium]|nr:hypothetical protein [Clostridiales bacterium]
MENSGKHCYRCKYFDRYYTKEVVNFRQTKYGWCNYKHSEVQSKESCEQFANRVYARKSNLLLKCTLNSLLTEITAVRNVLEADRDERSEAEEV